MSDPRRREYRAECQAAAQRGVELLKWPKAYSLFISNLNDNVNERLLYEELSSCAPVSSVNIAISQGRSLGLAHVLLQVGVRPDRFVKEFHNRTLLGQQMNVVVDHGSKKFDQAVSKMKAPKKTEKGNEAPRTSPKKRRRVTESPQYSPASPARPISDADGPSPSKPKRPRGNSPRSSPNWGKSHHAAEGHRHSNGHQQFSHGQRDSYRDCDPHSRSFFRHPANDSARDWGARYQESRNTHDDRSKFPDRNRFPEGDFRHQMGQSFGDYSGHQYLRRDHHKQHSHHSRRNPGGYSHRDRSPGRNDTHGYGGGPPDGSGFRNSSIPSNGRQNFSNRERRKHDHTWMDNAQWAVTLARVPRGATSRELLYELRYFYPRHTENVGCGKWTMWFDRMEDRDRLTAARWVTFKKLHLQVKTMGQEVGWSSTFRADSGSTRRHDSFSPSFNQRTYHDGGRPLGKGFGDAAIQRDGESYPRPMGRHDNHKGSLREERTSGPASTKRGTNHKLNDRIETQNRSFEGKSEANACQHKSMGGKMTERSAKERHREEERNRSKAAKFPGHAERDEGRDKHESPALEGSRTNSAVNGVITKRESWSTNPDNHKNLEKGILDDLRPNGMSLSPTSPDTKNAKDNSKNVESLNPEAKKRGQPVTPAKTSQQVTIEQFADMVAQHVYQTAKDALVRKGSAVHKGLVAQSVMKFVNSRREQESKAKVRAKAARAQQRAGKNSISAGSSATQVLKTAHLDLVETFLNPAKPQKKKPPLPDRQSEIPYRKKLKRSRFADAQTESKKEQEAGSSVQESEEQGSLEDRHGAAVSKRRRLELPNSPNSPDPGHVSPDGDRQNSVESVSSSELFRDKGLGPRSDAEEKEKIEESTPHHDTILSIGRSQVRHAKASSLKLSAPSTGDGAIPHLVLSTRPPPTPVTSGPSGSTFTTSEDSTSQGIARPPDVAKKSSTKKGKASSKGKKKRSRNQARLAKRRNESATDDEQYADVLLSLNEKLENSCTADPRHDVEVVTDKCVGRVDIELELENNKSETDNVKESAKRADDTKCASNASALVEEAEPAELEPPERVGKCARTEMYVRADHSGQHRQRNVHARTSTSTQSSRECRQENRVYRKGVSRINPKNDIISLNHLKQRRKKVSFGQSKIHGMGLYAKENIEAGEFIIEYLGDMIRRVVADLREKKYTRQGMGDSYLFRLAGDLVIDATRRGGIARYINHSCDPNVIAKIISVVGEPKIVFYSKRSIKEGEELTYDYKFDYEAEDQKIRCLCQAATCRKYLN